MHGARRLLAGILGAVAAIAIPLGAFAMGVQRGVFEADHAGPVASRLLDEERFQQEIGERFVDAAVQTVPSLSAVRERLLQLGFALQATPAYRAVFTRAVEHAYAEVLAGHVDRDVGLSASSLVAMVADRLGLPTGLVPSVPEGASIVLLRASDARALSTLDRTTAAIAIPALVLGTLSVFGAAALPGPRGRRLLLIGVSIAVLSLVSIGLASIAGNRLETILPAPGGFVAAAIWSEGLPAIRAWLTGSLVAGLAMAAIGVGVDVFGHQRAARRGVTPSTSWP